jgi:hypothetical protein
MAQGVAVSQAALTASRDRFNFFNLEELMQVIASTPLSLLDESMRSSDKTDSSVCQVGP